MELDFEKQGPVETHVLYAQQTHRSSGDDVITGDKERIIKFEQKSTKWHCWEVTNNAVNERLKIAGFYHIIQCASNQCLHPLLTAMVER